MSPVRGYGVFAILVDLLHAMYAWVLSLCCTVSCVSTMLDVNERRLRVVRLLAEGGFSFVYLVETGGKDKMALKKVIAQLPEQSELARWGSLPAHSSPFARPLPAFPAFPPCSGCSPLTELYAVHHRDQGASGVQPPTTDAAH